MRDRLTYRFPRTLVEAFGCDAETAIAVHGPYRKTDTLRPLLWVAVLLLALTVVGDFI